MSFVQLYSMGIMRKQLNMLPGPVLTRFEPPAHTGSRNLVNYPRNEKHLTCHEKQKYAF